MAACSAVDPGAGEDAGALDASAGADVLDTPDADPVDAPPPTCAPRPVTSERSLSLAGSAVAEWESAGGFPGGPPGTLPEEIAVYLPDGTSDGSRLVVAHPTSWPHGGLSASTSTITAGRADFVVRGSYGGQDFEIRGTFDVAVGGATAVARRNLAMGTTDVTRWAAARLALCRAATPVPEPDVGLVAGRISPLSSVHLVPRVPLGDDFAVVVRAGSLELPTTMSTDEGGGVVVAPVGAFPPNTDLELEARGTDVLGRPLVGAPIAIDVLRTTAVVTDPTFDTMPPEGSIVGRALYPYTWRDGAVAVGADGLAASGGLVSIALDPAGATAAHVALAFSSCGGPAPRVALVGASGELAELPLPCAGGVPFDGVLDAALPETGVVHLVVANEAEPRRPQWYLPSAQPPILVRGVTFD